MNKVPLKIAATQVPMLQPMRTRMQPGSGTRTELFALAVNRECSGAVNSMFSTLKFLVNTPEETDMLPHVWRIVLIESNWWLAEEVTAHDAIVTLPPSGVVTTLFASGASITIRREGLCWLSYTPATIGSDVRCLFHKTWVIDTQGDICRRCWLVTATSSTVI